jgi:hypothetical protein
VVQPNNTPGIDFQLDLAGSISGHVFQANGITPIAGAWVDVYTPNFDYIGGDDSATDGSYQIGGIPSGNYYAYVTADGYGGVYYVNGYDDPSATLIAVNAPAETSGIDFHLSPEAKITGYIYQSNGSTPIQGARVWVFPYSGGMIQSTTTDASGAYLIGGLATGFYAVYSRAPGYVGCYYGNAASRLVSTPIQVTQPSTTPGINFSLQTYITASIPTSGGTINYNNSQGLTTTIVVPSGGVSSPVDLTYGPLGTPISPSSFMFAGQSFFLEAYQGSNYLPGFTFAQPVQVTLQYSNAAVAGMDELQLKLLYFDTTTGLWVDAATTCSPPSQYVRDPANNRLTVAICHLSQFGLFGAAPYLIYLPKLSR